ncbi:N-acetyltransferase family protein [Thermus scotoductus]|uniref:GNAT family N-acetyltransferase n=1 Tax=Thermus scotoductus TaxID=37636 RepID=UPI0004766C8A|nr:GNAT family N-acetyltransferase [Thermus scotoductus]
MGGMRTLNLSLRPVLPEDAPLLHQLFLRSPGYFALIGMEPPALEDVARDLATLEKDERRRAFLLYLEEEAVGYLDYKLRYPEPEDATLSLLLIREDRQGQGLGRRALEHLLNHLTGAERLYAVVYGNNARAKAFFQAQGFRHVKDGGPTLSWYVREL